MFRLLGKPTVGLVTKQKQTTKQQHECCCCPIEVRNLAAVAHNVAWRLPDSKAKRKLEIAVSMIKPLMDKHFTEVNDKKK